MDKKTTSWISYISWVGWLIGFFSGDKEGAKFHLNQSLIVNIMFSAATVTSWIPVIRWFIAWPGYVFTTVCFVIGLIAAIKQEENEIPLVGKLKILK